ncbi:monovalent cation/H(+) antiporter subunit G, partial [Pseudomonas aeruginosa]
MTLESVLDVVALVLVLIGAVLCLTATIGLLRWPDVPSRLHAATKPQVLGVLLIVTAVVLAVRT